MNQVKIEYFKKGQVTLLWEVPKDWTLAVSSKNWARLDELAFESLAIGGPLYKILEKYCPINKVEHLISLREAPDEDGIWHDDGSRDLAFSLSLSLDPFVGEGLSLRLKGDESSAYSLGSRPYGSLTCFLTGSNGYEHRTNEVRSGSRLVLAGWIN